jgi:hypothetical protein
MPTYSTEDFERIAAAIGKDVTEVIQHKRLLEGAARWYRLDCGLPCPRARRTPPSKSRIKLQQVSKAARRLLKHLGVDKTADAYDGPGNMELLETLAWAEVYDQDAVVTATRRIGRLMEILEAVDAASAIEDCAEEAANAVLAMGALTTRPGHHGNEPVDDWIAAMMVVYREITGSEAATSVGGPDQPNEGIASGPLIRFLTAAGKPLGIKFSEDAWRSRVRTVRRPPKI